MSEQKTKITLRHCSGAHCNSDWSVDEFAGLCADCWKDLTPEERAVIRGEEPPVEKIVHHVRLMPMPRWSMLQWIYNIACGAVDLLEDAALTFPPQPCLLPTCLRSINPNTRIAPPPTATHLASQADGSSARV